MQKRRLARLVIPLLLCSMFLPAARAQETKTKPVSGAVKALVGTWERSGGPENWVPKLKVTQVEDELQFQFWGKASKADKSFGPAQTLHIVSRYGEGQAEDAIAFTTYEGSNGEIHFFLILQEGVLGLESVKIVDNAPSNNRLVSCTYTKQGAEKALTNDSEEDEQMADATDAESKTLDAKEKVEPKKGKIAGRIETASTMRGTLVLSPSPESVQPQSGIAVGSTNPQFSFSDVPEGEYGLEFRGTINGVTKNIVWTGLEVDLEAAEPTTLSLRNAAAN
ncbi:hypothetical protein CA13_38040 [Planctomycetes bacterium CA13]|uniref:Uncharacterized protein n=1 Tax=Novipirellula herctigrandis TaxID=2527986 RepID=A0A5C5Z4S4_9BACT|nr:hypothetical protein CA13_38040 [Planctomycetes bacterium CA13]